MSGTTRIELWLPSWGDLAYLTPDIVLTLTMLAIMIAAMVAGRRAGVCVVVTLAGLITMFFANIDVAARLAHTVPQGLLEPAVQSPMLIADSFTVFFKFFLVFFLVLTIVLWMMGAARHTGDAPEFLILLLGSALGMSLMVSSLNMLVLLIAVELASMPSYALVGFDKRSRLGAEASIKYVIFGSVSAAVMLYGASLLYGLYGTLNLAALAPSLLQDLSSATNLPLLAIGLVAFMAGVAFKISAVPFHFWCPDAFEGAQVEVTTWLSVASKAAGICLLLRIMYTLASAAGSATGAVAPIVMTIGVVAAITCFVGNLAAYGQRSVKRLLAYSSIAHAGYMMMFAAITLRPDISAESWTAVIVYLGTYLFMNLGAFGTTAIITWQTGSDSIEHFNGLGRRNPLLAAGMAVCLFSLVGMPPLGGFIAKLWLLMVLARAGEPWLWSLVIWASLNTLFSLFYYLRIIKHMYLIDDQRPALPAPPAGVFMVTACAVILLLIGTLLIDPVKKGAERYAGRLFTAPVTVTWREADGAAGHAGSLLTGAGPSPSVPSGGE
jgi:NADH-quinone oxidoreductase subunit N